MMDQFTPRSRRVLVTARDECSLLGHTEIGSEHLFLALIAEADGVAGQVLASFGVTIHEAREHAAELFGAGEMTTGTLPLTTWAKSALELSVAEAMQLDHHYVGTEHLLLGLIRMGKGGWRSILKQFDVNERDVRASVLGIIDAYDHGNVERMEDDMTPSDPPMYVKSGSPFEARYGFSRGVRVGDRIEIAGTAPIPPDGEPVAESAYEQMVRCCTIATAALAELGASVEHVVRTVMYITDAVYADDVGRAHGETFGAAAPASTMVVVASLLDPAWKVEIEVYAQL